jgi:hypothetical protein
MTSGLAIYRPPNAFRSFQPQLSGGYGPGEQR